jgi:hypothetical protein
MLIESYGRVVSVDIEFKKGRTAIGFSGHMFHDLTEQDSSKSVPLLRREHIYLLEMPEHPAVICDSVRLDRHISAWGILAESNIINMPFLHLAHKAGRRIHPVHHVFHLF